MQRSIPLEAARQQLDELVDEVVRERDAVIVNRGGLPAVAIVPVDLYQRWQAQRDRFFEQARRAAERANMEPDEADALVNEAIAWVRSHPSD
jgi:prevent-host-death family protein